MDPLALMELQARTLFVHDESGAMVSINEPGGGPPPMLFLGRTPGSDLLCFRAGAPEALIRAVRAVVDGLAPWVAGVPSVSVVERLQAVLAGHGSMGTAHAGPAFVFPRPLVPPMGAMLLYPRHAHMLHPGLATLAPELRHRRPIYAVLRGGQAVSVCYSARTTAEAAEAGVETVVEYRGQGCAALAADAWAQEVRAKGRVPFYSTSWDNAASLAVAGKLDLIALGEDIHLA
jgi:hypothetical protein